MSSHLPIPIPEIDEPDDGEDFSMEDDGDIPEWHKKILDERFAKYEREGFHGTPWEVVRREMHEEIRRALKEKRRALSRE